MDLNKKDLAFGAIIVVIMGLLTLFMRKKNVSASNANPNDLIGGGYKTAQTVYVPTTSYDLHYMTNDGTIINNAGSTTYAPTGTGGTVSMPTQDPGPTQTTTTSGSTTNPAHNVPTTAPTTAPIHESSPSPAPQGTNTAPIYTAPSQANALAQLKTFQKTIDLNYNGADQTQRDYLHLQKIELAREAGLTVDSYGYVYDSTGKRVDLGGSH